MVLPGGTIPAWVLYRKGWYGNGKIVKSHGKNLHLAFFTVLTDFQEKKHIQIDKLELLFFSSL
jgi:hypothetical protein